MSYQLFGEYSIWSSFYVVEASTEFLGMWGNKVVAAYYQNYFNSIQHKRSRCFKLKNCIFPSRCVSSGNFFFDDSKCTVDVMIASPVSSWYKVLVHWRTKEWNNLSKSCRGPILPLSVVVSLWRNVQMLVVAQW